MKTVPRAKTGFVILAWILALGAILAHYIFSPWGYYWKIAPAEQNLRNALITQAQMWMGIQEADGSHMQIIDLYNLQEPLPEGYALQSTDSWCAAFVTAAAMEQNLTDIIPPECGCERQIALFKALGRWDERDNIIPNPGDLIYYDWDAKVFGDCTGWSDHVGIVAGIKWPFMKVIEGNRKDCVSYRYLFINDMHIRGYGKPDYATKSIP